MLNQAVKRNRRRFPEDFMFQMTQKELHEWKSQIVISRKEKIGMRKRPFVFTDQGIAMLSSDLNSDTAIMDNIQLIRVFTKMRELLEKHIHILDKLYELERKGIEHDRKILVIFDYSKQLEKMKQEELEFKERKRIGYKRTNEK